ncbi:hypothetical protein [Microbacterium gorillae]|uniref:hypothetical protein n=1 Tax=Microbacterium gorillae TaxID=1231063 RepID=UPI000693AC59|nr:hypothetical protein [Microbacterium gorillae]
MLEAHRTEDAEHDYELAYPIYRVNFYAFAAPDGPWQREGWYLSGVDSVLEALAWVHARARGRRFELFAEAHSVSPSERRTAPLVRLAGSNPNEQTPVTGAVRVVHKR